MKSNCEKNLRKKRRVYTYKSHKRHENNHNKINESPFLTQIQLSGPQTLSRSCPNKSLCILRGDLSLRPKVAVKTLVTALDRDWRVQQGVCTSFCTLYRNLRICKEEPTVKVNSLSKDFILQKGTNIQIRAHVGRANSRWKWRKSSTCLNVSHVPCISVEMSFTFDSENKSGTRFSL